MKFILYVPAFCCAPMADEAFDAAQKLPLNDRLVNTIWRVRVCAYEELEKKYAEALDGNASVFKNTSMFLYINGSHATGGFLANILQDKNIAAKERGLSVVLVFFDRCDNAKR